MPDPSQSQMLYDIHYSMLYSGWLIDPDDNRHLELIQFTQAQLDNEQIYYMHDGNDTLMDEFRVMVESVVEKG